MKKLLLFLLLIPCLIFGQGMTSNVRKYGASGKYIEYTPTTMSPRGVILYLHGLGERGTDITLVERNEVPKLFKLGKEVPYIVIAPQLDLLYTQWPKGVIISMLNILDTYDLDKHVTGLSLGGWGTYGAILTAYEYNGNKPGYFKTAASVCGKSATTNWDAFKGLYIKIYHGTKDGTWSMGEDKRIADALTAIDKRDSTNYCSYKWYEGYGHAIWPMAYDFSVDGYWWFLDDYYRMQPQPMPEDKVLKFVVINDVGHIETEGGKVYEWELKLQEKAF
jgi:predicted peptidase